MRIDPLKRLIRFDHKKNKLALGQAGDGFKAVRVTAVTVDLASTAQYASSMSDVTVTGIAAGDVVLRVEGLSAVLTDGAILHAAYKAANTICLTFFNGSTTNPYNPGSQTFNVVWLDLT